MSLLTDFKEIEDKISKANAWAKRLFEVPKFMGHNENQWRLNRYNGSKGSDTYAPTLDDVVGRTPNNIYYYEDGYTSNFNVGDNYVGLVECWVHCTEDRDLVITANNDDYGAIYLDDALQFRNDRVGAGSGTVSFKKGWNHFQYVFYEHNGGDRAYINVALHTQDFIDFMYAYGERSEV